MNEPSSSIRFRLNAAKHCANGETCVEPANKKSSTSGPRLEGCNFNESNYGDDLSSRSNDRNREVVRKQKLGIERRPKARKKNSKIQEVDTIRRRQEEEARCLRHMLTFTVILLVSIVGGFIYLVCLVMIIDPGLQSHLPYVQKYISTNDDIFSSWRDAWQYYQPPQKATTITPPSDDVLNLNDHITTSSHRDDSSQPLQSSPTYTIPNSMAHIGDKSEEYALLRRDWDERFPPDSPDRSLLAVKELLATGNGLSSIYDKLQAPPLPPQPVTENRENDGGKIKLHESDSKDQEAWNYDIYDCPDEPPPGYPREYKTIDILTNWPPSQSLPIGSYSLKNANIKAGFKIDEGDQSANVGNYSTHHGNTTAGIAHLGLCVFDFIHDYEKALRYRSKEVPFVVRNDPRVAETVERWSDKNYRHRLFGGLVHSGSDAVSGKGSIEDDIVVDDSARRIYHRAERSITNQILFRHARKKPPRTNQYPSTGKREKKIPGNKGQRLNLSPPMPPPTKLIPMTYEEWYYRSIEKEGNLRLDSETGIHYYDANLSENTSSYYYYFRLVACGEKEGCERNSTEYLFDEMPFFQPRRHDAQQSERQSRGGRRTTNRRRDNEQIHEQSLSRVKTTSEDTSGMSTMIPESLSFSSDQESLYLVDPGKQRGIHCRFGMPGMIAVNHYDASRNSIVVLGGSRRYILSRPEQCRNLGLYPQGHVSARHSRVDWTTASSDYQNLMNQNNDNVEESETSPSWTEYRNSLSLLVNNATSVEVVLQAGDVLYLPSYWFHFIISLTTNMQCNTRSGRDGRDNQVMADCGFPPPKDKN